MSLVFLAMIGLVWPRIAELSVAVLGNPIIELAVRPFMGVGDKDKMGRRRPWSRLDFLRRDGEDVEPRGLSHIDCAEVFEWGACLPCGRVRGHSVKGTMIA